MWRRRYHSASRYRTLMLPDRTGDGECGPAATPAMARSPLEAATRHSGPPRPRRWMQAMPDKTPPGTILQLSHGGGGERPEPGDAPFIMERLAVLVHDISNLLDGS